MSEKYFIGYEPENKNHWFIQKTNDYIINSNGDYITNKGTFSAVTTKYNSKAVFNTLEEAKESIKDSERGYIRYIE